MLSAGGATGGMESSSRAREITTTPRPAPCWGPTWDRPMRRLASCHLLGGLMVAMLLLLLRAPLASGTPPNSAITARYSSRSSPSVGGSDARVPNGPPPASMSAKEARFKRRTKVVLVLGTGCNATFFDYAAEQSCSEDFAARRQNWRHPKPPCDSLPAVNKTAEHELGWAEWFSTDYRMAYTAVLRRVVPFLQQMGWKRLVVVSYKSKWERLHVPSADVVIAPQTEFERELQARYCNKQFIVVQTDDWATVSPTLDVNSPQILGVLMHDSFTDLSENNLPSPYMVRHNHWMMTPERLASLGPDQLWQRDPPITEANLRAKVHTIIPQIMRWMHPLDCGGNPEFVMLRENALGLNPNFSIPLHERSIDITFVGYVGTQWKKPKAGQPDNGTVIWTETMRARTGVMEHRQFAIDRILELRDKYGLNVVTDTGQRGYTKFIDLLRDTKVFVSPFGIGEFSGKDYEALMAGALVAKPMLRSYESYPNIYSSRYMLDTKADFSDLERVVMPYLQDESKLRSRGQERVDKAQKLLRKYSRMGPMAEHLDELLYKMLQQEEFTGAVRQKEGCYPSMVPYPEPHISRYLALPDEPPGEYLKTRVRLPYTPVIRAAEVAGGDDESEAGQGGVPEESITLDSVSAALSVKALPVALGISCAMLLLIL